MGGIRTIIALHDDTSKVSIRQIRTALLQEYNFAPERRDGGAICIFKVHRGTRLLHLPTVLENVNVRVASFIRSELKILSKHVSTINRLLGTTHMVS